MIGKKRSLKSETKSKAQVNYSNIKGTSSQIKLCEAPYSKNGFEMKGRREGLGGEGLLRWKSGTLSAFFLEFRKTLG